MLSLTLGFSTAYAADNLHVYDDRLRNGFEFVKIGPSHLKGFPQPVDVYGVEWR